MKVYLAAPFVHQDDAKAYASAIRGLGITVTSRWLDAATENIENWPAEAAMDLEDIRGSDLLVLLSEWPSRTGGKHFESGYAFALGKGILVVGPPENVFHHMPGMTRVESRGEGLVWLQEQGTGRV